MFKKITFLWSCDFNFNFSAVFLSCTQSAWSPKPGLPPGTWTPDPNIMLYPLCANWPNFCIWKWWAFELKSISISLILKWKLKKTTLPLKATVVCFFVTLNSGFFYSKKLNSDIIESSIITYKKKTSFLKDAPDYTDPSSNFVFY